MFDFAKSETLKPTDLKPLEPTGTSNYTFKRAMTDRYISERVLIENIAKIKDLRTLSTKTIGEAISNTPTADVVEVKHGEWENFEIPHMIRCSECGVSDLDIHRKKFDYCPYCGAKMDGERRDT